MRTRSCLVVLCMLSAVGVCSSTSAPGVPYIRDCRSPEKETFSCWWEPGYDGGLPTQYRLYYQKEKESFKECPDYVSAGENSCYFNKIHTSFWVEYTLRVEATNAFGNSSSVFEIPDVMTYVKPDPPVNVTVLVNSTGPTPYLQIKWRPPPNVDTKSGWATIKFELRHKRNDSDNWETFNLDSREYLNLYNIEPGALYMIQVRCMLDGGSWSDWTKTTFAKMPDIEKPLWILVFAFCLIPLLATICILALKREMLKQWVLPPVPGPKIRGVDVQLLKSGRTEDFAVALIGNVNFPMKMVPVDQVEEYLLVSDSKEWLLADPYTSEKKKDPMVISAGLHLESEIQRGKSSPGQNAWDKAGDRKDEEERFESNVSQSERNLLNMEPMEKPGYPSVDQAAFTNATQPLAHSSYVDIQQPENSWEAGPTPTDYSRVNEVNGEAILILNSKNVSDGSDVQRQEGNGEVSAPDDYSRVKEVNSDVVFLQKHESVDSCGKRKEDRCTGWTSQKPAMPLELERSKGPCSEMIGNGYVDSAPAFTVQLPVQV
ncbi:prolactin receptor b [Fundulus heteroclitus]|uniref:prolactin receptor b n=1 Tax=Fundulus heteroclitus TaxID=8078 RepID=UPI00165AF904|nr:prolactin receptor b [Fundulus heteroclitus]